MDGFEDELKRRAATLRQKALDDHNRLKQAQNDQALLQTHSQAELKVAVAMLRDRKVAPHARVYELRDTERPYRYMEHHWGSTGSRMVDGTFKEHQPVEDAWIVIFDAGDSDLSYEYWFAISESGRPLISKVRRGGGLTQTILIPPNHAPKKDRTIFGGIRTYKSNPQASRSVEWAIVDGRVEYRVAAEDTFRDALANLIEFGTYVTVNGGTTPFSY